MYSALWRILPGPTWLKILEASLLAAGVIALLFFAVFPTIADVFFTEPSTVNP